MSAAPQVGILGAYGAVGRAAVSMLAGVPSLNLRLAGRDGQRARQLAAALPMRAEAGAVDVYDEDSLCRFCKGCQVVLNCAGPSYEILERVALAAFRAGADYVDPGGDEPLYTRLTGSALIGERTALVTAGMMPGLSGLLPRWLALKVPRPQKLHAYVGGRDRLSPATATDYLLSLGSDLGEPFAMWRDGQIVSRALEPLEDAQLPFFTGEVSAQPFLSHETARVARRLELREAHWYNVFEAKRMLAVLSRLQPTMAHASVDLRAAAGELARAAELDLFGHTPYQQFVLELEGERDGGVHACTVVLRAKDAYQLTGTVAALAARAVLAGGLPRGAHFAAEALDPAVVDGLRAAPAIVRFDVLQHAAAELSGEEGAL